MRAAMCASMLVFDNRFGYIFLGCFFAYRFSVPVVNFKTTHIVNVKKKSKPLTVNLLTAGMIDMDQPGDT